MTIRRRSNRSAAAPPRTPNSSTGRYSLRTAIETRNGSLRLRRDEQRPGGEDDAVADVVDDRRGEEPAEAPPEPRRSDGLAQGDGDDAHRRQDSNADDRPRRENAVPGGTAFRSSWRAPVVGRSLGVTSGGGGGSSRRARSSRSRRSRHRSWRRGRTWPGPRSRRSTHRCWRRDPRSARRPRRGP